MNIENTAANTPGLQSYNSASYKSNNSFNRSFSDCLQLDAKNKEKTLTEEDFSSINILSQFSDEILNEYGIASISEFTIPDSDSDSDSVFYIVENMVKEIKGYVQSSISLNQYKTGNNSKYDEKSSFYSIDSSKLFTASSVLEPNKNSDLYETSYEKPTVKHKFISTFAQKKFRLDIPTLKEKLSDDSLYNRIVSELKQYPRIFISVLNLESGLRVLYRNYYEQKNYFKMFNIDEYRYLTIDKIIFNGTEIFLNGNSTNIE